MMDGEGPLTLEAADAALTTTAPDVEVTPDLPAAEPAADAGQPRDEQGRFASPAPTEETEAAPADQVESSEPRDEPTDAPETEGEVSEADDYPEASFEVDGQEIALAGTAVGDDGVFISPETWQQEVAPLLSAGRQLQGSFRQRMSDAAQQVQAAQAETAAAKAESSHVLAHFENLIEKSQDAIRQGTLESLLASPLGQWFLSVGQGWPILKADARTKAIEMASQNATRRLQEYEQREHAERMRPVMTQVLQDSIRRQGQSLGLDEQTLRAVEQKLLAPGYERLLFVPAPFDDPNGAFKRGETVIDHGVVAGALDLVAMHRVERQQQEKIRAAQAANAAQQPVGRKVPPTVGAKGRSPGGPAIPQPTTMKEADDLLLNGSLDWAEEVET